MDAFPEIPAVRRRPIAWAIVLFVVLFVVLPLAQGGGILPVLLLPLGRWVYVVGALVACAVTAVRRQPRARRASVAVAVTLMMLCCVLPVAGGLTAIDRFFGDFARVETVSETPSRSKRLVLVHEYVDQGALGGDDHVYVRSRLMPGLVEWRYRVPLGSSAYVQEAGWHDATSVFGDGRVHRVPFPMLMFGW